MGTRIKAIYKSDRIPKRRTTTHGEKERAHAFADLNWILIVSHVPIYDRK